MDERELGSLPLGEDVEVERGVIVHRRSFFTTAAVAFAAASLPGAAHARTLDVASDELSYEDFLKEVVPVAKRLVADTSIRGQDVYLLTLASFAARMTTVAMPEMRANGAGTFIGANDGGDPFVVLHWRMEPGSVISTHPHEYGNVVTLGLEGAARISNYEVVGPRDYESKARFVVRRTVEQWLTPGGINLVNLERNYMHGFVAGPNGARGLDITTRLRERTPSKSLIVEDVVDAAASTFNAHWKSSS